jgi:geranylgeranyl pyrophosphate synthase
MITTDELKLVEEALARALESNVDLLSTASAYIVRSGGKRLRPQIALLAYKACGGRDISQAVPLATAVELLHTASLVHDDINDRSDMRRGQATVNARWGNGLALLVGDYVFVKLLNLMAAFDSRVIRVLSDCCTAIVEGETLQMLHQGDTGITEETYLEIVRQKTASLFSACGELGSLAAGGAEDDVSALRGYGLNIGMAFQIRDDTLDLIGQRDKLGKPVSSDLGQGKMSMAALCALRRSEKAKEILLSRDAQRVARLLRETGALDYTQMKATEFVERAKQALAPLPRSDAKSELTRLANFAALRGR